jgi:hypothetical protein
MKAIDRFDVWGHPNITACNEVTFEFTREGHLTRRGDCIVGVRSGKGARDLSQEFRALARSGSARILVEVIVGGLCFTIVGRGSPDLSFLHPTDLVGRKSTYISDRTLMIAADKAAVDFPRGIIEAMRKPDQRAEIVLTVEVLQP